MAKRSPLRLHRKTTVIRTSPWEKLPDFLSRPQVRHYLGISTASADALIRTLPVRRFGKHIRVSKYLLKPNGQEMPCA